jgi:hypothetical protein
VAKINGATCSLNSYYRGKDSAHKVEKSQKEISLMSVQIFANCRLKQWSSWPGQALSNLHKSKKKYFTQKWTTKMFFSL